ncbi:hypothetical protein SH528x_004336 [Novipirellula sp. SH528]|uniref:hypothetical protein n=1 Tax=Novipirellula sp. SH528 TaxID=3454466 RepID=UPI003FA16808
MSYTVGLLVESPLPDDATAFEQFNALAEASDVNEKPHPTFVAVHAELTSRFPCICDLPDDQIDDGVWSDGPLINNFGASQAVIGFMFPHVNTVLPLVIEIAHKHGITVFDWQTETVHRPGEMVLTVEGDAESRNPTSEQLDATIERLTPKGGPGFAVLESTRGYVQAAGGNGLFTVEWREGRSADFQHFVAGKDGDSQTDVEIPTNGFEVSVKANECLNLQDVKSLFQTFLAGGNRPGNFVWRDVTERFV